MSEEVVPSASGMSTTGGASEDVGAAAAVAVAGGVSEDRKGKLNAFLNDMLRLGCLQVGSHYDQESWIVMVHCHATER